MFRDRMKISLAVILFAMLFAANNSAEAITAEEVLENVRMQHERSIQNIEDYVIETDDYTAYYKKTEHEGRTTFKKRTDMKDRDISNVGAVSEHDILAPDNYRKLLETARYRGTEGVAGYETHVLALEKMEGFMPEYEEMNIELLDGLVYIDAEEWLLRRMEYNIRVTNPDGSVHETLATVNLEEYQDIDGMKLPFRTVTIVESPDMELSEEEEQQMEEMKQRMAQMSDDEKEMMKRMMGDRYEQYMRMMETRTMETVSEINDVRVNVGLSDDLFE